jgi:hypothetical protein
MSEERRELLRQGEGGPEEVLPGGGDAWSLVRVVDVSLVLPNDFPELLLREIESPGREVRISLGLPEARSIAMALGGHSAPRPFTHDLLADLLGRHSVTLNALRITFRRGQVYFAELETQGERGAAVVVPCRPSDGIALVLRQALPVPILVAEPLFADEADEPV